MNNLTNQTFQQISETQDGNGPFSANALPSQKKLQSFAAARFPHRLRFWTRLAIVFFFVFAIAVCFVPWTQTVTVKGELSAYSPSERPQEIHAQINGRIHNWHVNEGMDVKKGDLVLELEDVNPQIYGSRLIRKTRSIS